MLKCRHAECDITPGFNDSGLLWPAVVSTALHLILPLSLSMSVKSNHSAYMREDWGPPVTSTYLPPLIKTLLAINWSWCYQHVCACSEVTSPFVRLATPPHKANQFVFFCFVFSFYFQTRTSQLCVCIKTWTKLFLAFVKSGTQTFFEATLTRLNIFTSSYSYPPLYSLDCFFLYNYFQRHVVNLLTWYMHHVSKRNRRSGFNTFIVALFLES